MYHTISAQDVLEKLKSSEKEGLTPSQVSRLRSTYGYNEFPEEIKESKFKKLLNQFTNTLVVILILAALVSGFLGEYIDAITILVIVVLNGILGFVQEARAEEAISALKKLATSYSTVIREGNVQKVEVRELIVGDIILLESGDKVPADARLIETAQLKVNEAILTGESTAVEKDATAVLSPNTHLSLGDRINMVYKDTSVVFGRGVAVVTATSTYTEIGKISNLIQTQASEETPLSKELTIVGKNLSYGALIIVVLIFLLGFYKGIPLEENFLTAISLAVAAIPEGLPAVVTIVLAIGVTRLAKKKAIIRKLEAVETLGSTNYILTDKTGTLTQNKMTVTNLYFNKDVFQIKKNKVYDEHQNEFPSSDSDLKKLVYCSVVCNDASYSKQNNKYKYVGDPTETALLKSAVDIGFSLEDIEHQYKRLYEEPFSSETKRMAVVVQDPDDKAKVLVFAKGAAEVISNLAAKSKKQILEANEYFAENGLRSLAFSYKSLEKTRFEEMQTLKKFEKLYTNHTFLGLVAQKDPIRPEVKFAIQEAKKAGITTIMITGDHKEMAANIGLELNLISDKTQVMDGAQLKNLKGRKLYELLDHYKVFSRVSPEQKLNIVQAVKRANKIAAVTGDGVNDAPAIKTAHIGISMGKIGTDVSKEVSDMVLEDDNYATIVESIKQGRIIYSNLVKFITYLISCNIAEIFLIVAAMLTTDIPALLPIQILWINLITDGLPALALGMEPGEEDIMDQPPRKPGALLTRERWVRIFFQSILMSFAVYIGYLFGLQVSPTTAQTMAMTTLAFTEILRALSNRSEIHSVFSHALEKNNFLRDVVIASIIIQLLVVYTPVGNSILGTTPIGLPFLAFSVMMALLPLIGTELYKFFMKYYREL